MPSFNRQALYEQVWSEPVRALAERFGVSDVGLKKCCAKADIPVPKRGYWAKLRAGKRTMRPQLPARAPGQPDLIHIGQERYAWGPIDLEAALAKPEPEPPSFDEPIETVRERAAKQIGQVKRQKDFASPHPAIAKLLADDHVRRSKAANAPYRLAWSEPLFSSPFERRRLKVLNSLFLPLAKAGAKPSVNDDEARHINVDVGAERVSVKLDHPDAKPDREGRYKTREGFADVLRLSIQGTDGAWSDTVEEPLEAYLSEIAVEIMTAGEAQLRRHAEENHQQALRQRLAWARRLQEQREEADRQARERAIKAERERQSELLLMAQDHHHAERIRALIDQVLRVHGGDAGPPDNIAAWVSWAAAVADRTDPVLRLAFDEQGHASLSEPDLPQPDG